MESSFFKNGTNHTILESRFEKGEDGEVEEVFVMKLKKSTKVDPVVSRVPITTFEGNSLYLEDMNRFNSWNLLNDANIDFLIAFFSKLHAMYAAERIPANKPSSIVVSSHAFSSLDKYCYSKDKFDLITPRAFFRDETRKHSILDIHSKVYLVVNELNYHWILIEVSLQKKTQNRFSAQQNQVIQFRVFDSLGKNKQIEQKTAIILLKKYFTQDFNDMKKQKVEFKVISMDTPVQAGGPDCGVFCCKFIECLFLRECEDWSKYDFSHKSMQEYRGLLKHIASDVNSALLKDDTQSNVATHLDRLVKRFNEAEEERKQKEQKTESEMDMNQEVQEETKRNEEKEDINQNLEDQIQQPSITVELPIKSNDEEPNQQNNNNNNHEKNRILGFVQRIFGFGNNKKDEIKIDNQLLTSMKKQDENELQTSMKKQEETKAPLNDNHSHKQQNSSKNSKKQKKKK